MSENDLPPSVHDLSVIIEQWIGANVRLHPESLRPVREQVAQSLLGSPYDIPAPPEVSGYRIDRRPIRTGDPIDVRLAKYIQHAVREEQWPPGTTFDAFLGSVTEAVRNERGGIYADRRGAGWRLTFVGHSAHWMGLDGGDVIVVLYDCVAGRLVTAFQPTRGLAYVDDNEQVVQGTWLIRLR